MNISFPDGWVELLAQLDADLSDLAPDYTMSQVKVKFGGLRYYFGAPGALKETADAMSELVRAAERAASKTCEVCGGPGVGRQGHWVLCDEHAEGREPWADND